MSSDLINPYLQARQLLGKSQQEVADGALVSVSCVRYNEQGLFLHPIPKLTSFFGMYFAKEALTKNYYRFQRRMRQINNRMWLLPEPNVFEEPLRATFRYNNIGPTQFCKKFCCQMILLYQPKRLIRTDLGKIFSQAGFTPVQIEELHDRLQEYHDRRNTNGHRSTDHHTVRAEILRDGASPDDPASSGFAGDENEYSSIQLGQAGS